MSTLFSQVASLFTARQTKKTSDFAELVKSVADGTPPSAEAIAAALEEFDRTPDELQAAVEHRQRRQQYAATLASLSALRAEKGELERKAEQENARYEALVRPLQKAHTQTIDGLNARYADVSRAIPVAESMESKLIGSYRGPLQAALDAIKGKQAEIRQKIATDEQRAASHEHAASAVGNSHDYAGVTADLSHVPVATAAAKACREEAAEARKALVPLVARENEILAAMLLP